MEALLNPDATEKRRSLAGVLAALANVDGEPGGSEAPTPWKPGQRETLIGQLSQIAPGLEPYLDTLHYLARRIVGPLVDGRERVPLIPERQPISVGTLKNGVLVEEPQQPEPGAIVAMAVLQVLRDRPFPFARCPHCAQIFVRAGRQKYCALACTYRATDAARRGKRSDYFRAYMRQRRKRQASKQRKK